MFLIQVFLPLTDNRGHSISAEHFHTETRRLTDRFGGLTVYSRAPAKGLWDSGGRTVTDEMVIFEVMAEDIDRAWWDEHRRTLEATFRQETVLVRASPISLL